MKYLFYFISFFCLVSCEITGFNTACDEKLEFNSQELIWINTLENLSYKNAVSDTISMNLDNILDVNVDPSLCPKPANKQIYYQVNSSSKISQFSFHISKTKQQGSLISFKFNSNTSTSEIPIVGSSQDMGYIDIQTIQPINTELNQYTKTTKLGTHQLGDKTYNDVFVIEDLDKNNVPEIDIFRFYVNPSGILRIEFYDGEIWDRMD